jgi:membrane protein DedA with SNARE-associated domain
MTVRSTALGFIGVIITIVAGAVLGIALLYRVVRRLRNRRAPGAPSRPASRVPEPAA